MPNSMPDAGGRPDPKAEHVSARSEPGQSASRQPSVDQGAGRSDPPEIQLGGADAIEKTTYVVGEGAEPTGKPRGPYTARDAAGGGTNLVVWVVGGVAALIALVYAIGIFR